VTGMAAPGVAIAHAKDIAAGLQSVKRVVIGGRVVKPVYLRRAHVGYSQCQSLQWV
jgi:hypothetical protein